MDEHVLRTYQRAEQVFVGGRGAELFDRDGRVWLDFLGGIAVSALGHAHPRLTDALRDQVGRLIHVSNLFRHEYTEEVAARLARLTGLEAVFFTNSGTEAIETALKLARKHHEDSGAPQRNGFVALAGGFHGRTLGALSITHNAKYRAPFEPLLQEVAWVEPEDVAALEDALARLAPAALVLEPIQGEGGVRELSAEYLRAARRACDATGTVLVHDEVQCGSGRTGSFLAADLAGVKPDVVTLAKPVAAGIPMGVCIVAKRFAATFGPGDHGSTFAGGPLACRAALVFLEELEEGGLLDAVRARGSELRRGLERLAREFPRGIRELRGRGLIQGLRVAAGQDAADALQKDLFRRGLIVNRTAGDVIRLLPPFVITSAQIERGVELLGEALRALEPEESRNPTTGSLR